MSSHPPEFSRCTPLDRIGAEPLAGDVAATPQECAALAQRFGLKTIARLEASFELVRDRDVIMAKGQLEALAVQSCIATSEDVDVQIGEAFAIRFVETGTAPDGAEIEIDADDCDVLEHDGQAIDMGEAAAQSFALALDPFPRSPGAGAALRAAGVLEEGQTGAFADLKSLLGGGGSGS